MYPQFKRIKVMTVSSARKTAVALAAAMLIAGATGISLSNAQATPGSTTPTAPTARPADAATRFNPGVVLACSTTNYTDVAAQALGITSPVLRLDLVSGKSLSDIASSKSVSLTTVQSALNTAFAADVKQAVSDGLLTQAQADQITSRLNSAPTTPDAAATAPAMPATPDANGKHQPGDHKPGNDRPGNGAPGSHGIGMMGLLHIAERNQVNRLQVAAKAIGIACPDLVKAVEGGQSIAQVATSKNVTAQAVIDALTAAEKTALAQDVSETLITQAQADNHLSHLTDALTRMVNNAGQDGFGGRGPAGDNDKDQPGNGQPDKDQPGNGQPGQPPAAATPAVGSSS